MSLNPELGVVNPANTSWVKVIDAILEADLMKDIQYVSEQIEHDSRLTLRELRGYVHQCDHRIVREKFAVALQKCIQVMVEWARLQGRDSETLWTERIETVVARVDEIVTKAITGPVQESNHSEIKLSASINDINWSDPEKQSWLLSLTSTTDDEAVRVLTDLSQRPEVVAASGSYTSLVESISSSSYSVDQFYRKLCHSITCLKQVAAKESIATMGSLNRSLRPLERYIKSIHARLSLTSKKTTVPKEFPRPVKKMSQTKAKLLHISANLKVADLRVTRSNMKMVSSSLAKIESAKVNRMRIKKRTERVSLSSFCPHPPIVVSDSGQLNTALTLLGNDEEVRKVVTDNLTSRIRIDPPTGAANVAVQLSKLVALRCGGLNENTDCN